MICRLERFTSAEAFKNCGESFSVATGSLADVSTVSVSSGTDACYGAGRMKGRVAAAPRLTRKGARQYLDRWKAVVAVERDELSRMSMAEKLLQLAGLMESARALGWERALAEEEQHVRARWVLLRKALGG